MRNPFFPWGMAASWERNSKITNLLWETGSWARVKGSIILWRSRRHRTTALIDCDAEVTRAQFKFVHEFVNRVQYTSPYTLFWNRTVNLLWFTKPITIHLGVLLRHRYTCGLNFLLNWFFKRQLARVRENGLYFQGRSHIAPVKNHWFWCFWKSTGTALHLMKGKAASSPTWSRVGSQQFFRFSI